MYCVNAALNLIWKEAFIYASTASSFSGLSDCIFEIQRLDKSAVADSLPSISQFSLVSISGGIDCCGRLMRLVAFHNEFPTLRDFLDLPDLFDFVSCKASPLVLFRLYLVVAARKITSRKACFDHTISTLQCCTLQSEVHNKIMDGCCRQTLV